ncbi:TlpA disulfide reductase family protein [Geobacter sp. DSM 9736]|uniref:TlpA family protein disulfide reductase n=1 Tax=Geobacter sp. DSM 9736 TaxID=1277350 RepID=UPI000B4FF2E6|nr:TlpA disulfide reductase family protein [Geobacter sp. DSM 9736]SNB47315.1 Peroxiredoxin [Geobacter sp. DSM 9736]
MQSPGRCSTLRAASALILLLITASPAAAILQKGQAAPPIKVVSTSGQQITLANYRGHVLLLDFFATWCTPCSQAIPHLTELNEKYGKQGFQILGMSVDEGDEKSVKSFISARKVNYPVAMASEELQTEYGLRSVPTLYLISKKGIVAEKYMGYSDDTKKAIEAAIKRLLAE